MFSSQKKKINTSDSASWAFHWLLVKTWSVSYYPRWFLIGCLRCSPCPLCHFSSLKKKLICSLTPRSPTASKNLVRTLKVRWPGKRPQAIPLVPTSATSTWGTIQVASKLINMPHSHLFLSISLLRFFSTITLVLTWKQLYLKKIVSYLKSKLKFLEGILVIFFFVCCGKRPKNPTQERKDVLWLLSLIVGKAWPWGMRQLVMFCPQSKSKERC